MNDENEAPEEVKEVIEAVVEEAREGFNLIDQIKNRAMRTAEVVVGFDEVNGARLGQIEESIAQINDVLERATAQTEDLDELRASLDSLDIEDRVEVEKKIAEREALLEGLAPIRENLAGLQAAADELREEVRKSSYVIELRAIPPLIARGATRRARAALNITEKGIPEALYDEYQKQVTLELCHDQMVRFTDRSTGESRNKLTVAEISALNDYLPISQAEKLFAEVNDLQFRNAVSESAIAQVDFSPAT